MTNLVEKPTTRRPGRPPRFYVWDTAHSAGVTTDRHEATEQVRRALETAPAGALGKVRHVTVNPSGRVEYLSLGKPAVAHVDAGTGALVWDER